MPTPSTPRRLHRGHFAFMRALAQGLDPRASWDRYLRLEGEPTDLRTVRATIAWIRDAFAAAARRENRPGTARLILIDPDRFSAAPSPLPSLAEFATAHGLDDFSEAEQIDAYRAAHPAGNGARHRASTTSRRARVIARQLEALRWLEDLVAQDPRPADAPAAWLHPSLAARLERAGLGSLASLADHINGVGARWWLHVPGVGERKAGRIVDWLRANQATLGLRIGHHVGSPRRQLTPAILEAVVAPGAALLPYEKFVPPPALDGRDGGNRAPAESCLLMADSDHAAIGAWLTEKGAGTETASSSSATQAAPSRSPTQRAYRKEAERLLLWCVLERRKPLSSLTTVDVAAFGAFLRDPPAAWCGPRHHQRWSPMWRPLEGPLSAAAQRHAMVVLRALFAFLVDRHYLIANPFARRSAGPAPSVAGGRRALSFAQWDRLDALLETHDADEPSRRTRRAVRWLYATGVRLTELTAARCEHLVRHAIRDGDNTPRTAWTLTVIDTRGTPRQVLVAEELIVELGDELARHGFARDVDAESNRAMPLLARFDSSPTEPMPWSSSGLQKALKRIFAKTAESLAPDDAQQLRKASPHWLRHSHGRHALQGREGRAPAPLWWVQNNLGHRSIATTSQYLVEEVPQGLAAIMSSEMRLQQTSDAKECRRS